MKKPLTILLLIISLGAMAQTKPAYQKNITLSSDDFQLLLNTVRDYRAVVIYDPGHTDDQKVDIQKGIDTYLRGLPGRVKLDSIKIDTAKIKK